MQDSDRVGADGETRTDLAQHRSLLKHVHIEAGLAKSEGGRQPADPATNDEDAQGLSTRNTHHIPRSNAGG